MPWWNIYGGWWRIRRRLRAKGKAASEWIRERFTWARSAEAIERRLQVLAVDREETRGGVGLHSSTGKASATQIATVRESTEGPNAAGRCIRR